MKMLRTSPLLSLLLVGFCAIAQETERESKLVFTHQGPVRGYKDSYGDLFVFYNIPYATAPTGPNRFKAPLPPPIWVTPLEAINRNIVCPQADTGSTLGKTMQEDCLVANIHVPDTKAENLPVVVYVHGGAFQIGYGDSLKPMTLVQNKNIIVVTFNYRLGIHGFLCLGTEDAPGNAGMKDQVALLRWVNRNIASFGGNPHDVTLVGCSAGSASVDLLMLSKTTDGLFNKIVSGSGASISPFTVQIEPLETAKEHAKVLNFTNVDDIFALGEFYKTVPFEALLLDAFMDQKDGGVVFAPCVERYIGIEMFLDEAPIHTLRTGNYKKLPIIYGFTDMEGLMRLQFFEDWKDGMNRNFSEYLPIDLHFKSSEEREKVSQTIKQFYFDDKDVSGDTILSYIDYFTDAIFSYSMLWTVLLHVENGHNNIYLYEFSYVDDEISLIPYTNVRGATHCAQNDVLSDGRSGNRDESGLSDDFRQMKEIIREMWHNFITTSEPVPKNSSLPMWPPVGTNRSPHMSLGRTVELKGPLLQERANFWDNIYAQYYRVPQPPAPHFPHHSHHPHHRPHLIDLITPN